MASPSTAVDVHFLDMPPRTADLDETWAFLRRGVESIMTHQEQGLPFKGYTNLYSSVYNYCTSTKAHGKLDGHRTGTNLVGLDLYNKLSRYLVSHIEGMLDKASTLEDIDLLRYYSSEWSRYTRGATYLNRMFAFLNRYWVKRERDEGREGVYEAYTLALVQWKIHFFMHIQKDNAKLSNAILKLIAQERNGELVDRGLIKTVLDSFISLGLDVSDPNKECLDVYREHFEDAFLSVVELNYKAESDPFYAAHSLSDYLEKVEGRMREEEYLVQHYLHNRTCKYLVSKRKYGFIREHAETMWDSLFDSDKDEDFQRMYELLSRIPEGLTPLHRRFEAHVKAAGLAAIENLVRADGDSVHSETKAYVDALLEVHRKNSETVSRTFKSEPGFTAAIDKAFREFVNRNAATGSSSTKAPELIAKHAEMLLRKNNKMTEEEDLESALNQVMVLFKYLEDKDAFQTLYTIKLSKRLIHGGSISDEAEVSMISKLKEACGVEYTNKMQRMFTDISLSKDLTNSFKERMAQNYDDMDITFSVMVLGTNFWPLNPPTHEFVIPQELVPTYDRFQRFYQIKHSGRKLIWLWNHSKNELRTNYTNQKYILMTSSYQMAVLLQYNKNDTLSLDELISATSISKEILTQVLAVFVKAKVLVNQVEQYGLNPGFKSRKIRVNLNQPIKAEITAESSDVLKAVNEDRKYVLQATIVRIMKARETMKGQALIQEVISQISQRFAPKVSDIKKAIEALLEKEYIERREASNDTFTYVA